MKNDMQLLEGVIRRQVRRYLSERAERAYLRKLVEEELYKELRRGLIKEGSDNKNAKRKSVMDLLQSDKYDHAQLAYHLWNPKDETEEATYRSLFSKKANGTPDADGVVREFTDEEITSLYDFMRAD